MVCVVLVQSCCSGAPWSKKEQEEETTYSKLAREAMAAASSGDFDASATLSEIRQNPAVQEKMRAMLRDPEAIKELSQLMRDPTFKSQVEAFAGNPEVAAQLQKKGANAFISDEIETDPRRTAKARAEAELEYDKYASQFSGEQNAATGLRTLLSAAKDSSMLSDAINDLNDPEMMAQAQRMMSDPGFQREMKKMMDQPEMRKVLEASRNFMSEASKDPTKMKELQDRVAALSRGMEF